MCFLWRCPPSHFELGFLWATGKEKDNNNSRKKKNRVTMLCNMFLKASAVRLRNSGWSQCPQKSLETLPGFTECQARLESRLVGSMLWLVVRKLCWQEGCRSGADFIENNQICKPDCNFFSFVRLRYRSTSECSQPINQLELTNPTIQQDLWKCLFFFPYVL